MMCPNACLSPTVVRSWRMSLAVAALALLAMGSDARAQAPELTGDLKAMQGTWVGQIRTQEPGRFFRLVMVVEGDRFDWAMTIENEGRRNMLKGRLKLDESTDPRQLDLTDIQINGQIEKPMQTVYALEDEGQTLRLGLPESPIAPRPKAMPVDPDRGPPRVIVFQKQKPKAPADKPADPPAQ